MREEKEGGKDDAGAKKGGNDRMKRTKENGDYEK